METIHGNTVVEIHTFWETLSKPPNVSLSVFLKNKKEIII